MSAMATSGVPLRSKVCHGDGEVGGVTGGGRGLGVAEVAAAVAEEHAEIGSYAEVRISVGVVGIPGVGDDEVQIAITVHVGIDDGERSKPTAGGSGSAADEPAGAVVEKDADLAGGLGGIAAVIGTRDGGRNVEFAISIEIADCPRGGTNSMEPLSVLEMAFWLRKLKLPLPLPASLPC